MPWSPSATSRTAAASVTMENTTSEAAATPAGLSAQAMPASMSADAFAFVLFQPVTWCPAASNRSTIPAPMVPIPTIPTFMRAPNLCALGAIVCVLPISDKGSGPPHGAQPRRPVPEKPPVEGRERRRATHPGTPAPRSCPVVAGEDWGAAEGGVDRRESRRRIVRSYWLS